jgi:hypothetical protein
VTMPIKSPPVCATCHDLQLVSENGLLVRNISVALLRREALTPRPCGACSMLWMCICAIMEAETADPDILYDHLLIDGKEHGDMLGLGPLIGHLIPSSVSWNKQTVDLQFYTSFGEPPPHVAR